MVVLKVAKLAVEMVAWLVVRLVGEMAALMAEH